MTLPFPQGNDFHLEHYWETYGKKAAFVLVRLIYKGLSTYGEGHQQASVDVNKLPYGKLFPCNDDEITSLPSILPTAASATLPSPSPTSHPPHEDTSNALVIRPFVLLENPALTSIKIRGIPLALLEKKIRQYDQLPCLIRFFIRLFTSIEKQRSLLFYYQAKSTVERLLTLLINDSQEGINHEAEFDSALHLLAPLAKQWVEQLSTRSRLYPWTVCLYALSQKPSGGIAPPTLSDFTENTGKLYPSLQEANYRPFGNFCWGKGNILYLFDLLNITSNTQPGVLQPLSPYQQWILPWQQYWKTLVPDQQKKKPEQLQVIWQNDKQQLFQLYQQSQSYLEHYIMSYHKNESPLFDLHVEHLLQRWRHTYKQLMRRYHSDRFAQEDQEQITPLTQQCNDLIRSYLFYLEQYANTLKFVRNEIFNWVRPKNLVWEKPKPPKPYTCAPYTSFLEGAPKEVGDYYLRLQAYGPLLVRINPLYNRLYRNERYLESKGWRKREETQEKKDHRRHLRYLQEIEQAQHRADQERHEKEQAQHRADLADQQKEQAQHRADQERHEKEQAQQWITKCCQQYDIPLPEYLKSTTQTTHQQSNSPPTASSSQDAEEQGKRQAAQTTASSSSTSSTTHSPLPAPSRVAPHDAFHAAAPLSPPSITTTQASTSASQQQKSEKPSSFTSHNQ